MPRPALKLFFLFFILAGAFCLVLFQYRQPSHPVKQLLWPDGAPGAIGTTEADKPGIEVFLPSAPSAGTGVVICPGGAYHLIMSSYEGRDIARWLNGMGVAAFVLQYRIAPRYHHPASMLDVQRAIRYVRYHASDYGIGPNRIGVIGFSAGGHLASTAETHFDDGDADASDPIDRLSSRPDFAILGYPIITLFPPYAHEPSVLNLFGPHPTDEERASLSNELHVTSQTPPTFIFHTVEDDGVPVENSLMFFAELRKNHVPAEMHLYEKGPHGAGLANGVGLAPDIPSLATWQLLAYNWLKENGLLSRDAAK